MSRSRTIVIAGALAGALLASGSVNRAAAQPVPVPDFGDNPGALEMLAYSPDSAGEQAPLVLVLHGCTQTAASMTPGGFEELADELGFHLVYPQQTSANNPVTCFNWAGEFGDPANLVRGQGENQSIASMVQFMLAEHSIDPSKVYIIGFSAGGGMASVMLATWPDLFAGGAILSGLPYRCATDVNGAFQCQNMNTNPGRKKEPAAWGDLVRDAFPEFDGPRPRVFIMHGTSDFIVHSDAAIELDDQWTDVLGIDTEPEAVEDVGGNTRALHERDGQLVVESWRVTGMGHAVPIGDDPARACGTAGAYFEDRDLCGAYRALSFFGLTGGAGAPPDADTADDGPGTAEGDGEGETELDDSGESESEGKGDDQELAGESASGCATAGTRGAASALYVLVAALAISCARRRRAARSTLPAPVRGRSVTSS